MKVVQRPRRLQVCKKMFPHQRRYSRQAHDCSCEHPAHGRRPRRCSVSKPAKLLQMVITLLMTTGALMFGILALLAVTEQAEARLAAAAFGVALLAAGANEIAGAWVV